jgi:hypothetical protein
LGTSSVEQAASDTPIARARAGKISFINIIIRAALPEYKH